MLEKVFSDGGALPPIPQYKWDEGMLGSAGMSHSALNRRGRDGV